MDNRKFDIINSMDGYDYLNHLNNGWSEIYNRNTKKKGWIFHPHSFSRGNLLKMIKEVSNYFENIKY